MQVLEEMLEREGNPERLKAASEACFMESFQIQQEQVGSFAIQASVLSACFFRNQMSRAFSCSLSVNLV